MSDATPIPQSFAVWNPISGVWETSQPDLYGRLAPYSETWPASGMARDGSAYPLPPSAHHIAAFVSSSSLGALFRTRPPRRRSGERVSGSRPRATWDDHAESSSERSRNPGRSSTDAGGDLHVDRGVLRRLPLPGRNASPDAPPQPRDPGRRGWCPLARRATPLSSRVGYMGSRSGSDSFHCRRTSVWPCRHCRQGHTFGGPEGTWRFASCCTDRGR
jgi:hypothetical protein